MVITGLDRIVEDVQLQQQFPGKVALLGHNASLDRRGKHAALLFRQIFGDRLVKLFGPQHGFATSDQDNMIETDHFIHPFFRIPVYSLYSETRVPTDAMLEGIDHLFVDLQDIGSRMYTYLYTLTLLLEKCAGKDLEVIVLDRPNPINGLMVEGPVLDLKYASFIGRHPLPVRHGLTLGELAVLHQNHWTPEPAQMSILTMQGWHRAMNFSNTGLPWALPSPNIARPETALIFPGTVHFEGTQLSEGRGTTQPFEVFGHPRIEPFRHVKHLEQVLHASGLGGVTMRPISFLPTFHKHANTLCGGYQVHVTDRANFRPWRTGMILIREMYHLLEGDFQWLEPPYEYVHDRMPIDILSGTHGIRHWVESLDGLDVLNDLEDLDEFLTLRKEVLLYAED
ncbi:MAG: DUF1343 domain-containing protein [Saprospiraceae bacterium]|nr:DUF1343 domain-containing protein [Saprospiraceae bacterium]MCB9321448.1 DUF1343 domain-containing protein [Lewinellaceae bacterium]